MITSGKWRRQIMIPTVDSCADNALAAADTRLPKNKSEGDIPKIAHHHRQRRLARVPDPQAGHRRLARSPTPAADGPQSTSTRGNGVEKFAAGFAGGSGTIPIGHAVLGHADNLKPYDIVILSCEGSRTRTPSRRPRSTR